MLNMSVVDGKVLRQNNNSKGDISINNNTNQQKRRKSKSRDGVMISNTKIKRFIEKKKKQQIAIKSLEQTIENEKQMKI